MPSIKEQILSLPVPDDVRLRILELTIKAKSYHIDIHTSEFLLTQAFDWRQTREGPDYWMNVYVELEQYKYEISQKKTN